MPCVKRQREDLTSIKDRRTRESITNRALQLERELVKQGKPLQDELQGYYSVRAAGQRIYELEEIKDLVVIVVIGIRKKETAGMSTEAHANG